MPTAIPPTVFIQITQTNSSPETIVALLNEAEATHSSTPRRSNAKRLYPFWKMCAVCSKPFPCETVAAAGRRITCSQECQNQRLREYRKATAKSPEQKPGMIEVPCVVCGQRVWKWRAWLKKNRQSTCSRQCNGVLRGQEWAKHAHKGRAAWSQEAVERWRQRMLGANNPAWKGGVTVFKKHGNYQGVRYVRCPAEYLPMARGDGYVMEHRLFVAQALGRPLLRREVVHHINHDPTDNRIENLMLFASNLDHKLYEHHGTPAPIWSL